MSSSQAQRYDRIPYESDPVFEMHAWNLSCIAQLHGRKFPSCDALRILELGCGNGRNLGSLASTLPGARCLGIDYSQEQVRLANSFAQSLQLRNVEFQHADLNDWEINPDSFDVILCHGLFSWVSPALRKRVLALVARGLSSDGVAYISYNTYPGWHVRELIRDLMKFHTRARMDEQEIADQARFISRFVSEHMRVPHAPNDAFLRHELNAAFALPNWYILHDYLEPTNDPLYFAQFAQLLSDQKLLHFADADQRMLLPQEFHEEARATVDRISSTPIDTEQYFDFLRLRTFRGSLVAKSEVSEGRRLGATSSSQTLTQVDSKLLLSWWVRGNELAEGPPDDFGAAVFTSPGLPDVELSESPILDALRSVLAAGPLPTALGPIVEEIRSRYWAESRPFSEEILLHGLLRLYYGGYLRLYPEKPLRSDRLKIPLTLSALAKFTLDAGEMPANALHERVVCSDEQRSALLALDENTTSDIIDFAKANALLAFE